MSALTDPGQRVAGNASSTLLLGTLQRPPFGVAGGVVVGHSTAPVIRAAMRTINAPDDYADYSSGGYVVPGYTLRDGDRLLVLVDGVVTALPANP